MIIESAEWSQNCQTEASKLNSNMQSKWEAMGIRVLTLIIQNNNVEPADLGTAFTWKSNYGLLSTAVAADPNFSFAPSADGVIGLPLLTVIDPRTMQIVHKQDDYHYPPTHVELEALAQKNASP